MAPDRPPQKSSFPWIVLVLPGLLVLGILVATTVQLVHGIQDYQQVHLATATTTATVLEDEKPLGQESDHHTIVSYTVDGKTHRNDLLNVMEVYSPGQHLSVRYDPQDPEIAFPTSDPAFNAIGKIIGLPIVLATLGLIALLILLASRRGSRHGERAATG